MHITYSISITAMRKMLRKELYKKKIETQFMYNGRIAGTLRFSELEIKNQRVIFTFDEVKENGMLHIEWSNVHDYIIKYFGKHNPGEDYFNLADAMRKLKIVEFIPGSNNYMLQWNHSDNIILRGVSVTLESINQPYFDNDSMSEFFKEIDGKDITKEQFITAFNEVFGGK